MEHINGSDTCYSYTNTNAAHHSYGNINAGVTDTASYSNLIPGKKYRIQGKIYNTETKEPALPADEEEITSSVTFIPMASQGSVKLDFSFDGAYPTGHKLLYIPKSFLRMRGMTQQQHQQSITLF